MMLEGRQHDIDKVYYNTLAETFGLKDAMISFAGMAIRYLGANPSIFPFDLPNTILADEVMEDILQGGNFGYHHQGRDLQLNKIGQWHRYIASIRRAQKFSPIAPGYFRRGGCARTKNRILKDLGLGRKNFLNKK